MESFKKPPQTCHYSMSPGISKMYWTMMNISEGGVLDVGSGRGGFGLAKPEKIKLYGIERDSTIAMSCKNYEHIFISDVSNMAEIDFDNIKFRGVLARDILEHIQEPWNVLDSLYNHMEPNGILICSVPKPDPAIVWSDYTHIRGFTKSALRSMLENSGFDVENIFPMSGYTLATKFGFEKYLPTIAKIPLINQKMVSWHAIARKSK